MSTAVKKAFYKTWLEDVKKHLAFVGLCVKYNLTKEMENRVAFIMQVVGMMLNNGIMLFQWVILFSLKESIGGLGFKEIMLLWGLASSTFGFSHVLFLNTTYISSYITGGKLDAYLVQPKNILVNVACSRMSVSALGDILYGILLALFAWKSGLTFFLFFFFTVTGGIILAAFYTISGSLAFFILNSDDLTASMNMISVTFSTYPEGLFSGVVRWLLFTLIPVGFSVYIPIRVLQSFDWTLFLAVIGFMLLLVGLAALIFRKGLQRYSSSSSMSSRL